MGAWSFECVLGLAQGTCNAYEPDKESRGYGRFGGCPSCKHRVSANSETDMAELEWRDKQRREEG